MASDTATGSPDITDTLAQRGAAYGDFREQGRITQNLKRAMQDSPNWAALPAYMKEGLDMVQHKVSRILNGDALYDDNLHDMIGYTKLMQDRARQDREAGCLFVTPGDRLYPAYRHTEGADDLPKGHFLTPVDNGLELPADGEPFGVGFEDRLAIALRELANLGFTPNDAGVIVNNHGEPAHLVLSHHVDPSKVPDPAFLNDPVRAYYAAKGKGSTEV